MVLSNITAFQLLIAGALLLGLAAFMLALSRERRITVQRSAVIEELAIHMGRIASALENLADPLRDRSHFTNSNVQTPVVPPEKKTEDPHRIAYSIFGR